ncbi:MULTISPECIES: hypothetical protein [unclassified Bradyrhizobium]|uniref:hypothetical protein n=1 Tax=unclassified Bradyrhizobium TaxID=2631580 RepID=UPI0035D47A87
MTERLLVAQLNADWRVTFVHDKGVWKCAAWRIEQLDEDGAWRGLYAIRSREMLLEFVRHRCGDIDPAAVTILSALPRYSYRRENGESGPHRYKRKKPIASQVVERKPAAPVAAALGHSKKKSPHSL